MTEEVNKETTEQHVVTATEARKLVAQEREERRKRCIARIAQVLREEHCRIDVIEMKVNGQVVQSGWRVEPED